MESHDTHTNPVVSTILGEEASSFLAAMAETAASKLSAQACTIYALTDDSPDSLRAAATFPTPASEIAPMVVQHFSSDLLGEAIASREHRTFVSVDPEADSHIAHRVRVLYGLDTFGSLLIVPVLDRRHECIGVIEWLYSAADSLPDDPLHDALRRAVGVCGEVALFIECQRIRMLYSAHLRTMSLAKTIDELIGATVKVCLALAQGQRAELALWCSDSKMLTSRSYDSGGLTPANAVPESSPIWDVWRRGALRLESRGVPSTGGLSPEESKLIIRWGETARPLGVLAISSEEQAAFSRLDAAILTVVLLHAAVAFRAIATARHLDHIYQQVFDCIPGRQEVLDSILKSVRDIFGFDAGLIYLADVPRGRLECKAWIGCNGQGFGYDVAEPSLATTVYREARGHFVSDPSASSILNAKGLTAFDIRRPLVGVPLVSGNVCVGALVVWHKTEHRTAARDDIDELHPFARLAGAYIAASEAARRREDTQRILAKAQDILHRDLSLNRKMRYLLEAIREAGLDRVVLFDLHHSAGYFECRCSLGGASDLTGSHIEIAKSDYLSAIAHSAMARPGARVYSFAERAQPGTDEFATLLGADWVGTPIIAGGRVVGQIAADNATSGRPITRESMEVVTAIGGFVGLAIATERMLETLSGRALPMLYDKLAMGEGLEDIIKRMLVYVTCGEALGFSRALFFRADANKRHLGFCAGLGSLTYDRHLYLGQIARDMGLARLMEGAPRFNDSELAAAMQGEVIAFDEFMSNDSAGLDNVRLFVEGDPEERPEWLARIMRCAQMRKLLVATLQESHRLWGLFIVDREWQPTGVTDSDVCSLKAFLRHAGQILRQHRAFHETMKHRDLSALGFIAKGLTHDLSDPIGVLQLDTGTFSRAVEEAEWLKARSCAQRIQTNVDRMVGTLSAFSSFLRPFDEFEVVDIARLLSTLHTLCYQCAKDHGITFAIEIRVPDGQRHVALRQGALRQALINLVANAEQALGRVARRDKRIQVTAEIEGGSLRIEGYDNGPGIPDRELQDVQRSRSGYTTDPMKGYGFGLELVRDAAEAHDGSFVLQSQEGIGTTAIIRIPLAVIEAP